MNNIFFIILFLSFIGCGNKNITTIELEDGFQNDFVNAVLDRTNYDITYNGNYFTIDYPDGDIPSNFGVCTDVVIRAYRKVGIDLQKLIHEDIKQNFNDYPISRIWLDQKRADSNIDHRRVPNLETYFRKYGVKISDSDDADDYQPGDIITWDLPGYSPWHIGVVTNKISSITNNPLIVHNIGSGPEIEDVLFDYPIRGHYRYLPGY